MHRLFETVSHLGADAQMQLRYLTELGTPDSADELALEFDDELSTLESMVEAGEIKETVAEALRRLSHDLKEMSGASRAALWTRDALLNAEEWDAIRESARAVLKLAGLSK